MLYIGSIDLMSGGASGTSGNKGTSWVLGASVNNGSPTGASDFGGFKYDFINLPEGNLSIITSSGAIHKLEFKDIRVPGIHTFSFQSKPNIFLKIALAKSNLCFNGKEGTEI